MTCKYTQHIRLIVISGALTMLAACSADYKLTPFSPPDGSFNALMPATPEYKTKTINAPDGAITVHSYAVMFDDVVYGVNMIDLPEDTKEAIKHPTKAEFMYAAAIQSMLASNGWRLIETVGDKLDLSATARMYGKKVTATIPKSAATVTVRMFVLDGRAYQAMTVVPKKSSYHQGLYPMRFLESFKLRSNPA